MFSLRTRLYLAVTLTVFIAIFIYPNFAVKEIDVFFHSEYKDYVVGALADDDALGDQADPGADVADDADGKGPKVIQAAEGITYTLKPVTDKMVERWVEIVRKRYSREGSIQIRREDIEKWPKNRHYVIRGRFITAAYLNKIMGASQKLIPIIDKKRTRIQHIPQSVRDEYTKSTGESIGEPGNFLDSILDSVIINGLGVSQSIRLGLDLQGGLSINIQGDFDSYLREMRLRYPQSKIDAWQAKVDNPDTPKKKREEFEGKLRTAKDQLELDEFEIRDFLSSTKSTLEQRLSKGQNIQEATVKIIPATRSFEVSIPGVSNPEEVKQFLLQTETVSYHLNHPNRLELLKRVAKQLVKYRETPPDERLTFLEKLERENGFLEEGAMLRAYYERPRKRLRRKQKEQAERNPIIPSIQDYNKSLVPRYFMVLDRSPSLDGGDIRDARPRRDPDSRDWLVEFELNDQGSKKFADVTGRAAADTRKNPEDPRLLAIKIGERIRSAPRINERINTSQAVITGQFTSREVSDVARIMSQGSLKVPLKVAQERNIGATLGEETIERGMLAVVYGFFAVVVFMIFYYHGAGFIANLALFLNLVILGGIMSMGQVTLTLPGFAGVILTLGMAVDTNVIIFERIKEELRTGKTLRQSVDLGFSRALWTVLDANITTMLAGIILIQLGEGPIKGFAVTLCMGIVSSLLTGLFMSRVVFDMLVNRGVSKISFGFGKKEYGGSLQGENA